jgi:hypothetical protein
VHTSIVIEVETGKKEKGCACKKNQTVCVYDFKE